MDLAAIARRVEGALERLEQAPPSRVSVARLTVSTPASERGREADALPSAPKREPTHEAGDTTETDSEPGLEEEDDDKGTVAIVRTHTTTAGSKRPRSTTRAPRSSEPIAADATTDRRDHDPTPQKRVYRRQAPRLLTSRVATAILAREQPAACELCGEAYSSDTRQPRPARATATARRVRCACCKRQLNEAFFSVGQSAGVKSEVRCVDCEKGGAKALAKLRKAIAEKKRLANEKRKATMAKKKQQQREPSGSDGSSEAEDVPPHVAKQRKRREQLRQRNFATFSRLILGEMGVGDVLGGTPLERLRADRARGGKSLVASKRESESDDDDDNAVSPTPPPALPSIPGRNRSRVRMPRRTAIDAPPTAQNESGSEGLSASDDEGHPRPPPPERKRAGPTRPSAKKRRRTGEQSDQMRAAPRTQRRVPAPPEIIEIDDSD